MTKDARIAELNEELNRLEDTVTGCDWCCGGGDKEYQKLLDELRDLGGEYVRVVTYDGEVERFIKYDFRETK